MKENLTAAWPKKERGLDEAVWRRKTLSCTWQSRPVTLLWGTNFKQKYQSESHTLRLLTPLLGLWLLFMEFFWSTTPKVCKNGLKLFEVVVWGVPTSYRFHFRLSHLPPTFNVLKFVGSSLHGSLKLCDHLAKWLASAFSRGERYLSLPVLSNSYRKCIWNSWRRWRQHLALFAGEFIDSMPFQFVQCIYPIRPNDNSKLFTVFQSEACSRLLGLVTPRFRWKGSSAWPIRTSKPGQLEHLSHVLLSSTTSSRGSESFTLLHAI